MNALFKAHRQVLITVMGLFCFLPLLAILLFIPTPVAGASSPEAMVALLNKWISANWIALTLNMLVTTYGAAIVYRVILASEPETLAQAMIKALPILPLLISANILANLAIGLGLQLFILPGLYLIGRLMFIGPAIVSNHGRQVLRTIGSALKSSGRHVLRLVAMAIFLFGISFIAALVLTIIFGSIAELIAPEAGKLFVALVQSAWISSLTLAGLLLAAAGWRLANAKAYPLAK